MRLDALFLTTHSTAEVGYGNDAEPYRLNEFAKYQITALGCPHKLVQSALDRWNECHWHIHQMEANYHTPDPFRYSLNSFIRAIKEIPQILKMELQNDHRFAECFKPLIDGLKGNDLLKILSDKRDFLVHRG